MMGECGCDPVTFEAQPGLIWSYDFRDFFGIEFVSFALLTHLTHKIQEYGR